MNLRRILKLLLGTFFSQGIATISQLVIPRFFTQYYGIEFFGEWNVLSASVNYLGTLNYGIQTYANNEMTIRYNSGDVAGAKAIQGSAFRLLGLFFISFAVLGLVVFALPIQSLLKLRHETTHVAALTLYLLILQIAFNMVFSLLCNGYMVVGMLHRGNYFQSAQRLFYIVVIGIALYLHAPFPVLALIQLGSLSLFFVLILIDVSRVAPVLLPSFHQGSWQGVKEILKPSGHFGLIAVAGFLTWQVPTIIIQLVLGPAMVGIFSLTRTIFQMSRQILSIASNTIGQDITLLVGAGDWRQLRRLYDLSERIVLFLIPIVSVGSLLMAPFLFVVWQGKRGFYDPALCFMMAIISAVLGIKEHKTQFQSSSNKHEDLSVYILTGYAIMLIVSLGTMHLFGLPGFLATWLIWEVIQTRFVVGLNHKMFPAEYNISTRPLLKLSIFMVFAFAAAAYPAFRDASWKLGWTVVSAISVTGVLGIAAYFVFDVDEIRSLIALRIKRRLAPSNG
jgi:O-antigen/teichoic acid export membrane protein